MGFDQMPENLRIPKLSKDCQEHPMKFKGIPAPDPEISNDSRK